MRKPKDVIINGKSLDIILKEHQHWLNKDCDGWENMKANLSHTCLNHIDLSFACLRSANLSVTDLSWSNLYRADLCGANLFRSSLYKTNLNYADLTSANLQDANCQKTECSFTDVRNANLCGTLFTETNLYNILNFDKVKDPAREYRQGKILTESIIGYKKCANKEADEVIVTLEIPKGAIVFGINGSKFRTNKAKVIAIDGADRAISYYKYMTYYVGDEFTIYNFNCQYNIECGEGIHFFLTREEAENF